MILLVQDLFQPEDGDTHVIVFRRFILVPHLHNQLSVVHRRQRLVEVEGAVPCRVGRLADHRRGVLLRLGLLPADVAHAHFNVRVALAGPVHPL